VFQTFLLYNLINHFCPHYNSQLILEGFVRYIERNGLKRNLVRHVLAAILVSIIICLPAGCTQDKDPDENTELTSLLPEDTISEPELSAQAPKLPLEGNITLRIQESMGNFSLHMSTQKDYGYGMVIESGLSTDNSHSLAIDIHYVYNPDHPYCYAMSGPAKASFNLGSISGAHTLSISYNSLVDVYQVTFDSDKISVTTISSSFTVPLHEVCLRLSPDVIWFNTSCLEPSVIRSEDYVYLNREDYESYVNDFFAQIEALGAQRFVPEEGYYPYSGFIPPWPDRHTIEGDYTKILNPDDPSSFWSYKWMDNRFYHFSGNVGEIIDIIKNKYEPFSSQLHIHFYNTEKQLY
jgi:hypothetical protein